MIGCASCKIDRVKLWIGEVMHEMKPISFITAVDFECKCEIAITFAREFVPFCANEFCNMTRT